MIEVTNCPDTKQWSDFVHRHPYGNIFQTPEMAEVYKRTKNYEPITLAVFDGTTDEILAILLAVVIREMGGIMSSFSARSIIQGGPLFIDGEKGIKALKILMDYYNKIGPKKVLYTQIRNIWDTSQFSSTFNGLGYACEAHLNFLINLTKSKEELWKGLSKKRRNGIRRAEKSGVTIKEIEDKSLIPVLYDLMGDTYANAKVPLADISLFLHVFNKLNQKNIAKFFLATHQDKYIGAIVVLMYNGIIYDWYAGASRNYLQLRPNDILAWHAIEWGTKNGYNAFDFGGAGNPNEEYGVREFKKQFGGEMVNFGRYTKVHSPVKMRIAEKGFKVYRRMIL